MTQLWETRASHCCHHILCGARKVGQEIRPRGSSMGKPSPSSRGQAPRCHPEGAARRICTPALLLGLLKLFCYCPDISKRKTRRPINGKVGQEIRPRGSGNICHPERSEGSDPRTPIALLSQRDGGFDSLWETKASHRCHPIPCGTRKVGHEIRPRGSHQRYFLDC